MANDVVLAKASSGDQGTPATHGGDDARLVIERPESNVTHVVDIGQAKAIVFGFSLDEVKIAIYDVDLVLVFPDGAKIILPGFALAIAGIEAGSADGLTIVAAGEEIDPQRLLAAVGETKIAEVTPLVSVTDLPQSTDDKQHSVETEQAAANGADAEAQGPGEAEPAPPPSPHKISDRELLEDNPKVEEAPVEIRIPRTEQFTSAATATSSATSSKDEEHKDVVPPTPVAPPLTQDSDAVLTLYAVTGITQDATARTIKGGLGAAAAADDPSLAAQTAPEHIAGTAQDDLIFADNPDIAPPGTMARVVDIVVTPPIETAVAVTMRISGLPDSMWLDGATKDGDDWLLALDPSQPNHVQFVLHYTLPPDGATPDGAGLYDRNPTTITFVFDPASGAGNLVMSQTFAVGEVNSEADVYRTNPATGETTIVLSTTPPGNIIDAGEGDDTIYAAFGKDTVDGGGGVNMLSYALSTSQVGVAVNLKTGEASRGYAEGDSFVNIQNLEGSRFSDELRGDDGDNLLRGGESGDFLDGGDGYDTADYSTARGPVALDLKAGKGSLGEAAGDTLRNFERVVGSDFNDGITGDDNANELVGGRGDDTLAGGLGADRLDGGAGNDTASYLPSQQGVVVRLGEGTVAGFGTGGDADGDVFISIENLLGSNHADELYGTSAANTLSGAAGDDLIEGRGGADTLSGGAGIDTLSYAGSTGGVVVDLDAGTASGGDAQGDKVAKDLENVRGGLGDDTLSGTAAANVIEGGRGDDILAGRDGADTLRGGDGTDWASYTDSAAVTVSLDGTAGIGGEAEGDVLFGIENLRGGSAGDTLIGDAAGNILEGGDGNDYLAGGAGLDTLRGGNGIDRADYSTSGVAIVATLDPAAGLVATGDAADDSYDSIEGLRGSDYGDVLVGNGGANVLEGGKGDDRLRGGAGADRLDGGEGEDIADYSDSGSVAVTVNLVSQTGSGGTAAGDSYVSIEGAIGSAGDDVFAGNSSVNMFDGGAGRDTLDLSASSEALVIDLVRGTGADGDVYVSIENVFGGTGNDVILASQAQNDLRGGAGVDTLSYAASTAKVTVDLTSGGSGGFAQGDSFSGFENLVGSDHDDKLTGSDDANLIIGGKGNDILDGGLGDDTLIGGEGGDVLRGGAGNDTASYATARTPVLVNLTTGATSGDAVGDSYDSIEILEGGSGNDSFTGNASANQLRGGEGDDTLDGRGGNDTLDGGGGTDTADYGFATTAVVASLKAGAASGAEAGNDTLISIERLVGGAGNDTLIGSDGDDSLAGGGGNDILAGGAGNDTLEGGAGSGDLADYSLSGDAVTVDLVAIATGGTGLGGDAQGDRLVGIENLQGSDFGDVLSGDGLDNRLIGGKGNDTLSGDGGNDILEGGEGDDRLIGGDGADILRGGAGNDIADYSVGGFTNVTVDLRFGGVGGDTYDSIEGVAGTAGRDDLTGNDSDNRLEGLDGDDVLSGGLGSDVLDGGAGTDTVRFLTATTLNLADMSASTGEARGDTYIDIEKFLGSSGDDRLEAGQSAVNFDGGDGNDTLKGAGGADTLKGGAGDDLLIGGFGADSLDGGSGFDTVAYANGSVTVDMTSSTGSGGEASGDRYVSIERFIGSSQADTFIGSFAVHTFDGAGGLDLVDYSASVAAINVDLSLTGPQAAGGFAAGDTLISIEKLTGGSGNDTIKGNTTPSDETLSGGLGDDIIDGRGGYDTIDGGDGNDRLTGGADFDTITGGAGNDVVKGGAGFGGDYLDGGDGIDTLDYSGSTAAVTVNVGTGGVAGGDAEGDTVLNFEDVTGGDGADVLTGSGAANVLTGGKGNDTLAGLDGDDVLFGNDGNDVLRGGLGNDRLDGGLGNDTVDYSSSVTGITITGTVGGGSGSEAFGDTLTDIELIVGSGLNDTVTASSGLQSFSGGAGNDSLTVTASGQSIVFDGGTGDDILFDAAGAPGVIFKGGAGTDTISYANTGFVSIDLSAGTYAGAAAGDNLTEVEKIAGSAFADTLIAKSDLVALFDGGAGDDVITGGGLGDTLNGGADNDVIRGGGGIDVIDGGAGNDLVYGDAGDDQLGGGLGENTVDGGAGNDIAAYTTVNVGVSINLTLAAAQAVDMQSGGGQLRDTLLNIESINTNNSVQDIVIGNAGSNLFITGGVTAGVADRIWGNGGVDSLQPNVQRVIDASLATSTITSGLYLVDGGSGYTMTYVQDNFAGTSSISFGGLSTYVLGSVVGTNLADTINVANAGWTMLDGGAGNDTLRAGAGTELRGGDGDDLLIAGSGANKITGGNGVDIVSYQPDTTGRAIVVNLILQTVGGTGSWAVGDTISGIEGAVGGLGDDTFIAASGSNHFEGGAGLDLLDYSQITGGGVTVVMGATSAATVSGVETIIGTQFADSFTGTAGDETFVDKYVTDATGGDRYVGGAGNDMVDYSSVTSAGVSVNLASGLGGGIGGATTSAAAGDTYSGIEHVTGTQASDIIVGDAADNTIFGSAGNDSIDGGDGSDLLSGNNDNDTLTGGNGNDTLNGGDGADTLNGGAGNDIIDGGNGIDTLSFFGATAGVTLTLVGGAGTASGQGTDSITGIENVVGGSGNDRITGDTGANILTGGAGDDRLDGGAGNDTLDGGLGRDTLIGGVGNDSILITGAAIDGGSTADGGTGTDLATISGSLTGVTVADLVAAFDNMETLRFSGATDVPSFTFTAADIIGMSEDRPASPSTDNTLRIEGIAGSISVTGETNGGVTSGGVTTYTFYADVDHTQEIAHLQVAA